MRNLRILLTACGAPGAPSIMNSLRSNLERDIEVIGADMDESAVGFAFANRKAVVPPGDDPEYIASLVSILNRENPVDAVVPLSTNELLALSRSVTELEHLGVRIAISSPDSIMVANNKARLYQTFSGTEVRVPEHKVVRTVSEFQSAVMNLDYPRNRVCFKPAVSRGSRGFRTIHTQEPRLWKLFSEKPDSTEVDYDILSRILSESESFPESLVMEYLPGREYSVDCLANQGNQILAIPRLRQEIRQGISFRATTEENTLIIDMARRVCSRLHLHGNIGMQFRMNSQGIPVLIEINPRLQGTVILCTAAGVNLPYLGLKLALEEEFSVPRIRWGIGIRRFWSEVFFDEDGYPYSL